MKTSITATLAAIALLAAAQGAFAQDERWTAWIGCWQLITESVQEPTDATEPGNIATAPVTPQPPRVCVSRGGSNAVDLTTTIEGQPAIQQTIVADGTDRPVVDGQCRGTQRTEWSRRGERLFARAEVVCDDKTSRAISGLALIDSNGTWLDIQGVRNGSREATRVRRYRRVDSAAGNQPRARSAAFTVDDVKEASTKVRAGVIEAALAETHAAFDLTSRRLIDLDDAGVPKSVIDLMVALSYPKRFVVERSTRAGDSGAGAFLSDPFSFGSALGYPLGLVDAEFGFYPAYYYTPFGYSYLGRFDPRYFGYGYIIGSEAGEGGGAVPPRPSGTGRVVDGQGYTRVRTRDGSAVASGSGAGGTSTSSERSSGGKSGTVSAQGYTRGDSGGSATTSSGSSGGSSSGGGGSAGGSSGDGGGRTAQPR